MPVLQGSMYTKLKFIQIMEAQLLGLVPEERLETYIVETDDYSETQNVKTHNLNACTTNSWSSVHL